MPENIEAQGLTVDEAIQEALNQLGVTRDKVEIKILHHARSGFLGLGARRAKVRATVRTQFMSDGEEYDMGTGEQRGRRRRGSRRGRGRRGRGGGQAEAGSAANGGHNAGTGNESSSGSNAGASSERSNDRRPASGSGQGERGGSGRSRSRGRRGRGGEDRRRPRSDDGGEKTASAQASSSAQTAAVVKHDPTELRERAESLMSMIISGMGIDAEVKASVGGDGEILVSIEHAEAEGLLIGRRGQTLDALEHIINRMVTRGESAGDMRVVIDIGDYRERRKATLLDLAERLSSRARNERRPLQVSPMSPHDRKLFQEAVESHEDVTVRALGTGFYRRVEVASTDATGEAIDAEAVETVEQRSEPRPGEPAEQPEPAVGHERAVDGETTSEQDDEEVQPVVAGQPHALNADHHSDETGAVDDGVEEDELDPDSVRAAVERYNKRLGFKVPPGGRN